MRKTRINAQPKMRENPRICMDPADYTSLLRVLYVLDHVRADVEGDATFKNYVMQMCNSTFIEIINKYSPYKD